MLWRVCASGPAPRFSLQQKAAGSFARGVRVSTQSAGPSGRGQGLTLSEELFQLGEAGRFPFFGRKDDMCLASCGRLPLLPLS